MCASNKILVDERHFLPQILRPRSNQRRDWIDVAGNLQHARSDRRKNALNGFYDSVVERMNRAPGFVLANDSNHQRLDSGSLDLDVDHCIAADRVENGGQRRYLDTLLEPEFPDLVEGEVSDPAGGKVGRVDNGIVMDDDDSVARRVHVELDGIGAELDRAGEGGNGVLGDRLVCPPVGDPFRRGAPGGCVQAFPRVVALGTMSAKL